MAGKSLIVLYIIGISVDNAVIAGGVYVLFKILGYLRIS